MTIWFSPELTWHGNERAGKTGRPTRYSNHAIQTILTLKMLFTQALRQAELNVTIPVRLTQESLHLLIDSTGLKFYGEGEWKVKKHGMEYRRG